MSLGADIVANLNSSYYGLYIRIISPITLLYYDYISTFNDEVIHFWSPLRYNWGTVVFLLTRYLAIFGYTPVVAKLFISNGKEKQCTALESYHDCITVAVQIIAATVMVLRVHALWERSRVILVTMLVFACILIAFSIWCMLWAGKYDIPPPLLPSGIIGCRNAMSYNQAWRYGAAWSSVFLFDAMIFGLTVYKTLKIRRTHRRTMVDILLRDGCMYFAVMSAMTLSNILFLLLGGLFTRGLLVTYTNTLASICSARLMINVRDPKIQWTSPQAGTLSASNSSGPVVSTIVDAGPTPLDETLRQDDIELGATKATKNNNRYK